MLKAAPLVISLALLACSGMQKEMAPAESPTATAPAASGQPFTQAIDLATFDFRELIYWEDLLSFRPAPATPYLEEVIQRLVDHPDERYRAFLTDLSFYPTPYRDAVLEKLLKRRGPFDVEHSLQLVEEAGYKGPEDDLPEYIRFKQRLIATISAGVSEFLDWKQPKTISAQEVFWGGVCVDCIPPLENPRFLSLERASAWINPTDQVIGVEINGDARAYPRRIIDWHEMVNDTVGGVPVSLAYCTLCGSAILYDGRHGGEVYRFGTSGLLYRSNKLMYDRNTRSLWEQYTGEPAWGPLVGQGIQLDVLPVVHTTWQEWAAQHPDTLVLDINTGVRRDYGAGVAYKHYWASPELIFPAPGRDGPLARKDWVYAVRLDRQVVAYSISLLLQRSVIHDRIGNQPVVVIATPDGSGGRAYDAGDYRFSVEDLAAGTLRSADGRRWQMGEGSLVSDGGESLERLPGHNSFWFAVVNHAPNWRLYEEK